MARRKLGDGGQCFDAQVPLQVCIDIVAHLTPGPGRQPTTMNGGGPTDRGGIVSQQVDGEDRNKRIQIDRVSYQVANEFVPNHLGNKQSLSVDVASLAAVVEVGPDVFVTVQAWQAAWLSAPAGFPLGVVNADEFCTGRDDFYSAAGAKGRSASVPSATSRPGCGENITSAYVLAPRLITLGSTRGICHGSVAELRIAAPNRPEHISQVVHAGFRSPCLNGYDKLIATIVGPKHP